MVKFVIEKDCYHVSFLSIFYCGLDSLPVVLFNLAEITFLLWRMTGDGSKILGCEIVWTSVSPEACDNHTRDRICLTPAPRLFSGALMVGKLAAGAYP
jgi:hypothetical protein